MTSSSRAPVIVSGSHRSGTTWVGEMLTLPDDVAHVHEPLNPANRLSWLSVPPHHAFQHIDDSDVHGYGDAFDDLIALRPPFVQQLRTVRTPRNLAANVREAVRCGRWRRRNARVLVKDPLAFFAVEWFADRYDADVVLLVRHPAAFAGSLKRQNWQFDFHSFTEQAGLMEGPLRPFAPEIERAAMDPPDIIDQANLLWRCINDTVHRFGTSRPEWTIVRYEDVAAEPVAGARRLYQAVGQDWNVEIERRVRHLSQGDNPTEVARTRTRDVRRNSASAMWTWTQRLSSDEIDRVRRGTEDVASRFYGPDDWAAPAASSSSSSSEM